MNVLIDNKDLKTYYGITVLDYRDVFAIASIRENQREWNDKSGIDNNINNVKYDSRNFTLKCFSNESNIGLAYNKIKTLIEYIQSKGNCVLSLRESENSIYEAFLVTRQNDISADINIRQQDSLYVFNLQLIDVNPNCIVYNTTIASNTASINYTKGQSARIYWGDGSNGIVSNSGTYEKADYSEDGIVDIIIDIDKDSDDIASLTADFSADVTSGVKIQDVQFTDLTTGTPTLWSWDFGDGNTSDGQNPLHSYTEEGTYTVTLQVFNDAKGVDTITKTNYITIRNSRMLVNDSGDFALVNDSSDYGLKN